MTTTSNFERISKIGKGSYGVVYKARIDDKIYAVKRNLTDDTTDFVGCLRELDLLLRLNHPNIVILEKILYDKEFPKNDHQEEDVKDDHIHFCFEISKYDLHKMIYYYKTNLQINKKIMIDILLGIEYVHSRGIIHRDMKPSNVLIFEEENVPHAKLCDFNLSKPFIFQGINSPKIITSCYRPPEILEGKLYDTKVDIWSIGCIFYEMVCKKRIISGSKDKDIMKEINQMLKRNKNVPHYASAIPEEYKDIIPLLENIFTMKAESRWTATQLLNHSYFDSHRDYILAVHEECPLRPPSNPVFEISSRKDRDEGAKVFIKSLAEHSKTNWYRHRTFFLGIDIFERYMTWCDKNKVPIYSQEDIAFVVYVCLYMSIKFYSVMSVCPQFHQVAGKKLATPEHLKKGLELELKILEDVIDFKVFRKTVYEAVDENKDKLTIGVIQSLLQTILCQPLKVNGKNVLEVAKMVSETQK